ncbi:MAG: Zn-ribbon domain-containing OB-fold protein [bacterium]|nr:Zn-ribbon domain-containing OB-fold protein [bacterium]
MTTTDDTPARPPIPRTEISQGFWDAIAEGRLAIQRCTDCGLLRHYPQLRCPACHSDASDWQTVSGRGRVHSYTVSHRAFHPAWKDHVPYVIATIELDEGVRMVCDLLDADPETIAIDQAVEVRFEDLPGQGPVPRFEVLDDADRG